MNSITVSWVCADSSSRGNAALCRNTWLRAGPVPAHGLAKIANSNLFWDGVARGATWMAYPVYCTRYKLQRRFLFKHLDTKLISQSQVESCKYQVFSKLVNNFIFEFLMICQTNWHYKHPCLCQIKLLKQFKKQVGRKTILWDIRKTMF